MKITDLKCAVIGGSPVVRITTDEGLYQSCGGCDGSGTVNTTCALGPEEGRCQQGLHLLFAEHLGQLQGQTGGIQKLVSRLFGRRWRKSAPGSINWSNSH